MPLTYDMTAVKDWETLNNSSPAELAKSHYLCFGLMAVGVGTITEKTWNDAYVRLHILDKIVGPLFSNPDGSPAYLTPADIFRRIGYKTNASDFPFTKFIKNLRTNLQFDAGKAVIEGGLS
jgi:hypothetical protein